jgi:hypothetical protein
MPGIVPFMFLWVKVAAAARSKGQRRKKRPRASNGDKGSAPIGWGLKNETRKILKHTGTVFQWRGKVAAEAAARESTFSSTSFVAIVSVLRRRRVK